MSSSRLRSWGHEEPKAGRADSSTALVRPEQLARSWWAVCGHSRCHSSAWVMEKLQLTLKAALLNFSFPDSFSRKS